MEVSDQVEKEFFKNFRYPIRFIINHLSQGCTTPATTAGLLNKIPLSYKLKEYFINFTNLIILFRFALNFLFLLKTLR
jgi:hypothetical protein